MTEQMQVNFRLDKQIVDMLDALAELDFRSRTKEFEFLVRREFEAKGLKLSTEKGGEQSIGKE